jgi:hypothetical protein
MTAVRELLDRLSALGCRELVLCPKCGHTATIIKPDLDACEDD